MIGTRPHPDIALRIKADHIVSALQILRARGHHPVDTAHGANGSVLVRFGQVGDDLSYAIAAALPLEYYDVRAMLDNA